MKKQYAIGIDFGTLSARAVLMDLSTGEILPKDAVYVYPHGVLTALGGKKLPNDYALAHPTDYDEALAFVLREVLSQNGVSGEEVVGIGMDATSSSVLPVDASGEPLCFDARFADEPHAYIKIWKHHGAIPYVARVAKEAERHGETFPVRCGSAITTEFYLPTMLETLTEAPEVYEAADRFLHVGDYLARRLTGTTSHSMAYASIKEGWNAEAGYPSNDYLAALDPRLRGHFEEKTEQPLSPVGACVGRVNAAWAQKTGLAEGTPVATPIIDAHAAFGMVGIENGVGLLALGTSACLCVNAEGGAPIRGVLASGCDAMKKGMTTYDAGLCCVGDLFDWFVKHQVPASYERRAAEEGISVHALLTRLAAEKKPCESGLLALGWWNGNRCTLADDRLSGLVVGMRLGTRAEDIYRALIESTAFAMRHLREAYLAGGVAVDTLVATGGIALKNPLLMQIYADVMNCEISVLASSQSTAGGSARFGAVAGGYFADIAEAKAAFPPAVARIYTPIPEHVRRYDALYREYLRLHDGFGLDGESVMKRLWCLREQF